MVDLPPLASQTMFFESDSQAPSMVELFPTVWSAAEGLSHPNAKTRLQCLEYIQRAGAARISPLVAYMVATRLSDSEMRVRTTAVRILIDVLDKDSGFVIPVDVRKSLAHYLSDMRTRQIYSLIGVVVQHTELLPGVARLLNFSPFAGSHLVDIAMSKRVPLDVRRYALKLVGMVGYIDAQQALDRLLDRLESRKHGQQTMPFAGFQSPDEFDLLPEVRSTLALLRSL